MLLKKVHRFHAMFKIVLMNSNRLFTSASCVRMNDLPGCWLLFTYKGTFLLDSLLNGLAGHYTLGLVHTLSQNSLHSMGRTLCTDDVIILMNFIFTGLHGYQIAPGLGSSKQRHRLLLLKTGIHVAPARLQPYKHRGGGGVSTSSPVNGSELQNGASHYLETL